MNGPFLHAKFFTDHPASPDFCRHWVEHFAWRPDLFPVYEWEGLVFVAATDAAKAKEELANWSHPCMVVQAESEAMEKAWQSFQSALNPGNPGVPLQEAMAVLSVPEPTVTSAATSTHILPQPSDSDELEVVSQETSPGSAVEEISVATKRASAPSDGFSPDDLLIQVRESVGMEGESPEPSSPAKEEEGAEKGKKERLEENEMIAEMMANDKTGSGLLTVASPPEESEETTKPPTSLGTFPGTSLTGITVISPKAPPPPRAAKGKVGPPPPPKAAKTTPHFPPAPPSLEETQFPPLPQDTVTMNMNLKEGTATNIQVIAPKEPEVKKIQPPPPPAKKKVEPPPPPGKAKVASPSPLAPQPPRPKDGPQPPPELEQAMDAIRPEIPAFYHTILFAQKAGNSFRIVYWPSALPIKKETEFDFSLSVPSPFRIALRTEKPYHGYVVMTPFLEKFLKHWNEGRTPEVLSVVPTAESNSSHFLVAFGSVQASSRDVLQQMETLARKIQGMISSPAKAVG